MMSPSARKIITLVLFGWVLVSAGTHYLFVVGPVSEANVVGLQYSPAGFLRLVVPFLVVASVVIFIFSFLAKNRVNFYFVFVFALLLLVMLSGVLNASYYYDFYREFVLVVSVILVVGACARMRDKQFIYNILMFITYSVITLSYAAIIFLPQYGVSVGIHEGRWQGVFTHKNQLGVFCVFAMILIYHSYIKYRKKILLLVGFACFYLAWRSGSTLAMALILFVSLYFVFHASYWLYRLRFLADLGAMFFVLSVLLVFVSVLLLGLDVNIFGKEGFNNRDVIWQYYYDASIENIFVGHGLGQIQPWSRENSEHIVEAMGVAYPVGSAHNGFIELLFSNGLLGFLIFVVLMLLFYSLSVRSPADRYLHYSFLTVFLVINVFESRLFGLHVSSIYTLLVFSYLWVASGELLMGGKWRRKKVA